MVTTDGKIDGVSDLPNLQAGAVASLIWYLNIWKRCNSNLIPDNEE